MNTMIYEKQGHRLDLAKITRLYPAAIIDAAGESVQVSLEWADLKKDVVTIAAYVLVFDFDPVGEVPQNRVELRFETKEALFESMDEVARFFNTDDGK